MEGEAVAGPPAPSLGSNVWHSANFCSKLCVVMARTPPVPHVTHDTPAGVAEWQTHRIQNPAPSKACGFDSHPRHCGPKAKIG